MHESPNGNTSILAHEALCFEEFLEEDWKCEHLNGKILWNLVISCTTFIS